MAHIVVLGAGVMGSAFTVPLADRGHTVHLVGTHLDGEIIALVRQNCCHPRLGMYLPEAVVPFTYDQLGQALRGADLVVLGVSSAGVDWAAQQLGPVLPAEVPVVMLTKGLRGDGQRITVLPQALRDQLPAGYRGPVCAIGGPSIAGELAVRRHTSVVLAAPDRAVADRIAGWLRTPTYHVVPSTDLVGVEVCAALKNLYAIGVGLATGLLEAAPAVENNARMHNPAAAIFTQALIEMGYLVQALGGHPHSVQGLAGAGDLYVTCQAGRNHRMGRWLGLGMRYSEAKARYMAEDTVEGGETALAIGPTVEAMMRRGELDRAALPLMRLTLDLVCRDALAQVPWDTFFGPYR